MRKHKNMKALSAILICMAMVLTNLGGHVSAVSAHEEEIEVAFSENVSENQESTVITMQLTPSDRIENVTRIVLPNQEEVTQSNCIDYTVTENKDYTFMIYYTEKNTSEIKEEAEGMTEEKVKEVCYSVSSILTKKQIVDSVKEVTAEEPAREVGQTVSGETDYFIFNQATQTITGYSSDADAPRDIVIPLQINNVDVLHIGANAFAGQQLTSVVVHPNIDTMGERAFANNPGLVSVEWNGSLSNIGTGAFENCSGLTSIIIPNSVTDIGDSAFSSCSGLTSITIPNSVTDIGDSAFSSCSGLTSITIPNSVTDIGDSAFSRCHNLTSITIPNSVTSIGDSTFSGCYNLTGITIPDSVTSIGHSAFASCGRLTGITIPDSVTSIGHSAFAGCGRLTGITIPDSVTSIGNSTFYNCYNLTVITIPDSVTSIGNGAFTSCDSLTGITIPDSVTSIDDNAFLSCNSLTNIVIEGNDELSISSSAFQNGNSALSRTIKFVNRKKGSVENEPWGDKYAAIAYADEEVPPINILIEGKYWYDTREHTIVQYIGTDSVLTIPDEFIYKGTNYRIEGIGEYSFVNCNTLTQVTVPDSVINIGEGSFGSCNSLLNIIIEGNGELSIGTSAFSNSNSAVLRTITFTNRKKGSVANEPWGDAYATIKYADEEVPPINILLDGKYWYNTQDHRIIRYIGNDSVLIIPEIFNYNGKNYGVNGIGDSAFSGCSGLTNITIPNSVTFIGYSAFSGCSGLTNITIPNSVTDIWSGAFSSCSGLTNIAIPNSVTDIRDSVFSGCSGLTNITIPNSVTFISYSAFSGCSGLTNIVIPNSVTDIGGSVFYGCSGLTSITLSNNVGYLAYNTFEGSSIANIYIKDSRGSKNYHLQQPWGAANTTKVYYAGEFVDFEHSVRVNDTGGYDILINAFLQKNGVLIDRIILPDGSVIRVGSQRWDTYTCHVDTEGSYKFIAYDSKGVEREYVVYVEEVDIVYDENNGNSSRQITECAFVGDKYILKSDYELGLKKSNAIFLGYSRTPGGSGTDYHPGDVIQPTTDTILYAVWETVAPGTVIYKVRNGDENLGTLDIQRYTSTVGETIGNGIATASVRSGDAVFIGWYKEGKQIENLYNQIIEPENNVYEARFILDRNHDGVDDRGLEYPVHFTIRTGDEEKAFLSKKNATVKYGERLGAKAATYQIDSELAPDVTFDGWYRNGVKIPNLENEVITEEVTYEARFNGKESKYRVSFAIDSSDGLLNAADTYLSAVYGKDEAVTVPSVTAAAGKRFMGWYEQDDDTRTVIVPDTKAARTITYHALVKEEHTVELTMRPGDEGLGVLKTAQLKVLDQEKLDVNQIEVSTGSHVKIEGWYKKGTDSGTETWNRVNDLSEEVITTDCSYQVRLLLDQNNDNLDDRNQEFTITFDSNGGKEENTTIHRKYQEELGTLPKVTRVGYRFDGWYDAKNGGSKVEPATKMKASHMTCYARWIPISLISPQVNGGQGQQVKPGVSAPHQESGSSIGGSEVRTGDTADMWGPVMAVFGSLLCLILLQRKRNRKIAEGDPK